MKTWSCLFFTALLGTSRLFAAEPPVKLPVAEMEAYMLSADVPPIKPGPKSKLFRDSEDMRLKWYQRALVDPFAARLSRFDAATKERATHTALEGIKLFMAERTRDPKFTVETLEEECAALAKAKVDDPLLLWLQSWAHYWNTKDEPTAEALYWKARKHPLISQVPLVQIYLNNTFRLLRSKGLKAFIDHSQDKDLVVAAQNAVHNGAFGKDEDQILIQTVMPLITTNAIVQGDREVRALCAEPELPEWPRLMLTGRIELKEAGAAYANQLEPDGTPQGHEGELIHVQRAREAYRAAHDAHPERYEAGLGLGDIIVNGVGDPGDSARFWFDAAVNHCFDDMRAYSMMRLGYSPYMGGGGSREKSLAFGYACALTQRYDTAVPFYFFDVIEDLWVQDNNNWRHMFEEPLVGKVAVALGQQRVQQARTPKSKELALVELGVFAYAAGDYKTAAEAFEKGPRDAPESGIFALHMTHFDLPRIRGEACVFAAGMSREWRDAENAMEEKKPDDAVRILNSILPKVTGYGAELVKGRLTEVLLERELAKGDWVRMNVAPGLAAWDISKGEWEGMADGTLVLHGKGNAAYATLRGRVGTDFQLRGSFEIKNKAKETSFGVLLGRGYKENVERWIGVAMDRDSQGSRVYFLDRWTPAYNRLWVGDEPNHAEFLITCRQQRISMAINGREVYSEIQPRNSAYPYELLELMPEGRVGFGNFLFPNGSELRILKPEVRLLPTGGKPSAPPAPPAVANADQLLKSMEGTVWRVSTSKDAKVAPVGQVTIRPGRRDFFYEHTPGTHTEHHALFANNAHSLKVDRQAHVLTFSDDGKTFEVTNWPRKDSTQYGTLISKPTPGASPAPKPFPFSGTQWKRLNSVLDFYSGGAWHEDQEKPAEGTWKSLSDLEVEITLNGDRGELFNKIHTYTVSEDGQILTRDDDVEWKRIP